MGASIKNMNHQTIIKTNKIDVMNIFLKKNQVKINTKIPKVRIDQGWHQGGFKSQKPLLEFDSI